MAGDEDSLPLHTLVWSNEHKDLEQELETLKNEKNPETRKNILEAKDVHGRTPLMLAVCLGYLESTKQLLQAGANVNTECDGWTVVQEATASANPHLLQMVLDQRDRQRYTTRVGGIPSLLVKLKDAPDFYVEMTWEFTSWLPLVSRMCPSDTYKVYKRGSSVRVDTTLLGFDQNTWVRGSRTYIFTGSSSGAKFYEIDHDTKQVYIEEMGIEAEADTEGLKFTSCEQVEHRLATPLVQTYLDTENISFQRIKGGFFGWGGDKTEEVSGMECKVFGADRVEIVTKTRTEHMTREDKLKARANKNPLLSFFGPPDTEIEPPAAQEQGAEGGPGQSKGDFKQYIAAKSRADSGLKLTEECSKAQKFKAHLWLCENYPLSLQEQVMPIVDLLAISNTHFQKLKHFIQMQLPSGFPVKIEIPLFHVINARITFSNIQALDTSVEGVTSFKEDCGRSSAAIDDSVFEVPRGYQVLGGGSENTLRGYQGGQEQEEIMLQYAIRQSLGETTDTGADGEQVNIWEALEGLPPGSTRTTGGVTTGVGVGIGRAVEEDVSLQQAIEASLRIQETPQVISTSDNSPGDSDELTRALLESEQQERRDRQREEEELARVIELSLREK